jgi:hypothetical protein
LNKTFDQNIAEFRKHLERLDPECAKIFIDNQTTLLGDAARTRANRTAFNEAVLEELKALPAKNRAS